MAKQKNLQVLKSRSMTDRRNDPFGDEPHCFSISADGRYGVKVGDQKQLTHNRIEVVGVIEPDHLTGNLAVLQLIQTIGHLFGGAIPPSNAEVALEEYSSKILREGIRIGLDIASRRAKKKPKSSS